MLNRRWKSGAKCRPSYVRPVYYMLWGSGEAGGSWVEGFGGQGLELDSDEQGSGSNISAEYCL